MIMTNRKKIDLESYIDLTKVSVTVIKQGNEYQVYVNMDEDAKVMLHCQNAHDEILISSLNKLIDLNDDLKVYNKIFQ